METQPRNQKKNLPSKYIRDKACPSTFSMVCSNHMRRNLLFELGIGSIAAQDQGCRTAYRTGDVKSTPVMIFSKYSSSKNFGGAFVLICP